MIEEDDTFFTLKIVKKDILKMILWGSIGLLVGLWGICYIIYEIFMSSNLISFLTKVIDFGVLIGVLGLILWTSSIFFISGLNDLKFFFTQQGIVFFMDMNEIRYYDEDTKRIQTKTWTLFEDVGCYKQESKKLLYKYQIKFLDGDSYTFDLRGIMSTDDFVNKIEEFVVKYAK